MDHKREDRTPPLSKVVGVGRQHNDVCLSRFLVSPMELGFVSMSVV